MKNQIRTIISKEKMIIHLIANKGNVRGACNSAVVSKSQFYDWLKSDLDFRGEVTKVYQNIQDYSVVKSIAIRVDDNEKALMNLYTAIKGKLSNGNLNEVNTFNNRAL